MFNFISDVSWLRVILSSAVRLDSRHRRFLHQVSQI